MRIYSCGTFSYIELQRASITNIIIIKLSKLPSRRNGDTTRQSNRRGGVRAGNDTGTETDTRCTGGFVSTDKIYAAGDSRYVSRIQNGWFLFFIKLKLITSL